MKKNITAIILLTFLSGIQLHAEKVLKPVAFYLKNLPIERIGTETDEKVINDLKADNFLVVEVDCSAYPQTSPGLEEALVLFHENCPKLLSSYEDENTQIDYNTVFYVPEGYTITRNIPIWNIREHGAEGSLQRVMQTYNDVVAPKFKIPTVTKPEDMVGPAGQPIDYNLYMDIVHPTGNATQKVPLLLNFASNYPRMNPFTPKGGKEGIHSCIFYIGCLTTGYAFANVDHCYNPLSKVDYYGYFDQYTLDDWNGLASTTAYVRYLKSHAAQYNLNEKIGVMGISKASYSAMRISNTKNAEGSEYSLFNGTPNNKPQPWPGISSTVDVAYCAAGNGTRRAARYIDENTVPFLTSAGSKDEYNQWNLFPEVVKCLQNQSSLIYYPFWMEELGHTYPGLGTDLATGINRYELFKEFFDNYLKPSATSPLKVFYVLPKENASEVDSKGNSRTLVHDGLLPSSMFGLSAYSPVTIRFLSEMSLSEIEEKVKVYNQANEPVPGEWTAKMKNTLFVFTPSADLIKDETYRIVVPSGLKNLSGQDLQQDFIRTFVVTKRSDDEGETNVKSISPTDDTHTPTSKNTTPSGSEPKMRIRYSSAGEWRFDAYMKFNITGLNPANVKSAKLKLSSAGLIQGDPIVLSFYKTTTNWTEGTLISTNRPALDANAFDQIVFTGVDLWTEVEMTSLLKNELIAGNESLSIAIRAGTGNTENVYFNSKENENESLRPLLMIEEFSNTGFVNTTIQPFDIRIENKMMIYNGTESVSVDFFDISGNQLLSKQINGAQVIDLSRIGRGIYIAVISNEKQKSTLKIAL